MNTEYFSRRYLTIRRWTSFWHQIDEVLKTKAKSLLEIGVGSGVVAKVLREAGVSVTTFDISPELKPDVVGNILELEHHFSPSSFDCILCAQVLEHLPFESFKPAIEQIYKTTKSHAVISLPYHRRYWGIIARFYIPLFGAGRINIRIPRLLKHEEGEHKWEIGKSGYPLKKIESVLRSYFHIERRFYPLENIYHIFFRLRKKEGSLK
ncbi:MAG: class I SAM-dependent methyltransferase [Planctomycetota bacterium]|nr:class I SAM-dependent methyltransferase [Planctomycetota bacterium]